MGFRGSSRRGALVRKPRDLTTLAFSEEHLGSVSASGPTLASVLAGAPRVNALDAAIRERLRHAEGIGENHSSEAQRAIPKPSSSDDAVEAIFSPFHVICPSATDGSTAR